MQTARWRSPFALALVVLLIQGPVLFRETLAEPPPAGYTLHAPILLQGDRSLSNAPALSGVVGGSGIQEDPYVIRGWDIIPVTGFGIRLENVSKHVLIEGNLIHDGGRRPSDACVQSMATGVITCFVPVEVPQHGIEVISSSNITIRSNLIQGNDIGVLLAKSSEIAVTSNIITTTRSDTLPGGVLTTLDQAVDTSNSLTWPVHFPHTSTYLMLIDRLVPHGIIASHSQATLSGNFLEGFRDPKYLRGTAILVEGSELVADSNTVNSADFELVSSSSDLRVTNNRFSNSYHGVFLFTGTRATFQANLFTNSSKLHVCGVGTGVEIRENVFVQTGVQSSALNPFCPNDALYTEVLYNDFTNESWIGFDSMGLIEGNAIARPKVSLAPSVGSAIFVQEHAATVRNNRVSEAQFGITTRQSDSLITGNAVSGNRYGVFVYGPVKPTITGNSVLANAVNGLFNTDALSSPVEGPPGLIVVSAESNWWGSPSGPPPTGENSVYGAANVDPWLVDPPA